MDIAAMVTSTREKGVKVAAAGREQTGNRIEPDAAIAGILALLVNLREERVSEIKSAAKTEVLLANAGLPASAIAALTGKNLEAVRKAIQRGRSK